MAGNWKDRAGTLANIEWPRLILWAPALLGAGIAWYFALPGPTKAEPWAWAAVFGALAALLAHCANARLLALLGWAVACLALGGAAAAWRLPQLATPMLQQNLPDQLISGVVEDVLVQPDGLKLTLSHVRIDALERHEVPVLLRITTRRYRMEAEADNNRLPAEFTVGDRILMRASLFPPPPPASPGAFDYARNFYFQRIGGIGFSYDRIIILQHADARAGWEQRLDALRLRLGEHIRQTIGGDEGAIAMAMMTGQQNAISKPTNEAMRIASLSHVLSISGLHLVLAAGIMFVGMRLLLAFTLPVRWRDRGAKKIGAILALLSAFAYLALAGFPIAAERSYVMIAFVMLAVLLDRQAMAMRSLAVAAFVLLLCQPEALLTPSFKLSFAATLAIVAWAEWALPRFGEGQWQGLAGLWRGIALFFIGGITTSLVATLATAPLIMADFQQFNSYGVVSNLLLGPLIEFWIMPLVVLAFLLMPLHVEAGVLWLLGKGMGILIWGTQTIAQWPGANMHTPTLQPWAYGLVVTGGLWLLLWKSRMRWLGLTAVLIGVSAAFFQHEPDLLISAEAKQVAARDGAGWRMLTGSVKNLTAQQWKERLGISDYATAEGSEWQCSLVSCQRADNALLLRFDAKPPRAYKPRPPKIPDSHVSPAVLKRRLYARARAAEKRAAKQAEKAENLRAAQDAAEAACNHLPIGSLLIELREAPNRCQPEGIMRLTPPYITKHGALAAYRQNGRWHLRDANSARGHWPWIVRLKEAAE